VVPIHRGAVNMVRYGYSNVIISDKLQNEILTPVLKFSTRA
jgi:hypothetical protein